MAGDQLVGVFLNTLGSSSVLIAVLIDGSFGQRNLDVADGEGIVGGGGLRGQVGVGAHDGQGQQHDESKAQGELLFQSHFVTFFRFLFVSVSSWQLLF